MFKFLKSKKGFTLVELMIVVVIMAILVAVAVPIYSAVTKKAKIKTCAANQREIQSQLSNNAMSEVITLTVGNTFTIETDANGDTGSFKGTIPTGVEALFQKVPFCPEKGAVITVTVVDAGFAAGKVDEAGVKVTTKCSIQGHDGYVAA